MYSATVRLSAIIFSLFCVNMCSAAEPESGLGSSALRALAFCNEQSLKTLAPKLSTEQAIVRLFINDAVNGIHIITLQLDREEVSLKSYRVVFDLKRADDFEPVPARLANRIQKSLVGMQSVNLRQLWGGIKFFEMPQSIPPKITPLDGPDITIEAVTKEKYRCVDRSFILDMRVQNGQTLSEINTKSLIIYACGLAEADVLLFQKYVGPDQ